MDTQCLDVLQSVFVVGWLFVPYAIAVIVERRNGRV